MTEEKNFYADDAGVRITNSRLIFGNATYAMANVASVRTAVTNPSQTGPVVLILIGVLFALIGFTNSSFGVAVFGIFVGALGVLWLNGLRPTFHIRISSSSGEADALSSRHRDYIDRVVQAINEAIISRG